MELIILAAGKGSRIFNNIKKNKCLININGKSLIEKIIYDANNLKIFNKIKVVVGYKKDNIKKELKKYKIEYIYNKDFSNKEMLHSLKLGIQKSKEDAIITYSDIIYSKKIFTQIYKSRQKNKFILPIKKNWKGVWIKRKKAILDDCESLLYDKNFHLKEIGNPIKSPNDPMGQFMGIFFIPKKKIKRTVQLINLNKKNKKMHTTNFLNYLAKNNEKIYNIPLYSNWYEFDDYQDYLGFFRK